jgi:hypothetical protein
VIGNAVKVMRIATGEDVEIADDGKDPAAKALGRANLTMRMHNRRFTRRTNAFSKKFENHAHMVAIYAVWYNWIRIHKTLRVTPAIAAGLSKTLWTGRALSRRWARKPRSPARAVPTRSSAKKIQTDALPSDGPPAPPLRGMGGSKASTVAAGLSSHAKRGRGTAQSAVVGAKDDGESDAMRRPKSNPV